MKRYQGFSDRLPAMLLLLLIITLLAPVAATGNVSEIALGSLEENENEESD